MWSKSNFTLSIGKCYLCLGNVPLTRYIWTKDKLTEITLQLSYIRTSKKLLIEFLNKTAEETGTL